MRLSIFVRLIITYLMLFGMITGVSSYFIYHLDHFNRIIRSIILGDTVILEYSNQLSDALLSEYGNDRKFIVLKDAALYENYLKAGDEFNLLLNDLRAKTISEEINQILSSIDVRHLHLNRLINTEQELLKTGKPYSAERYANDKKQTADAIIAQLRKIKQTSEKNVLSKIIDLSQSGDKVKNVSTMISFFALSTGLLIAIIITRSIKKPLDLMKAKTMDISQGNFKGDLNITSPPEMVELAKDINTMCRKLQEVNDVKADFFSHMSHELRTPLTSIKEGTMMLLDGVAGGLNEKQQRILSIVINESGRLIGQVNSLLDLSKMEAGMLEYQFMPIDLSGLVKESLNSLAPLAEAKSITIDNNISTLRPVKGDQERMLQVFRNIIGNAIKFNYENGAVKLEAQVRGDVIEVSVHDTGLGIPKEELEKIFQKFQQGTAATAQKIKGTGLGLAAVKQIILAHGGNVCGQQAKSDREAHFSLHCR